MARIRPDKNYFILLKELVRLEEKEENEQAHDEWAHLSPKERQLRGRALLGLILKEKHFSPAEHDLATFVLEDKKELPLFSLEIGDVVNLAPEAGGSPVRADGYPSATVYEKTRESITVALGGQVPEWLETGSVYQLHKSVNRLTYKRMIETLDEVLQTQNTRLAFFRDLSIGKHRVVSDKLEVSEIRWFDRGLNDSQKECVLHSLAAQDLALVHGPPGTGKTRALVEIIRQSLLKKQSVFVTAPSNTACDNILERLVGSGVSALRLGHPARIAGFLREHTLDFRLALHPLGKTISESQRELALLQRRETRYRTRRSPGVRSERELRGEIFDLSQEIRKLKKEVFDRVMKETEVIVGTPTSVKDRAVRDREFDLVVIDEATQATEPVSWIPVSKAKKVIMAGDHFQLPPTVRSREAEAKGLGLSLFERFYDILGKKSRTLLDRQYRMNEKIMGFSSRIFYKNLLVADESVRSQTLCGMRGVKECAETLEPLVFIDTAGKGFEEHLEEGSESRYNPEEADLVLAEVKKMLDLGVGPGEIAVISPYSAQVRLLSSRSPDPRIEIDSVDGFQGREKEFVIVCLVRSNMEGEMGFLADTRRMNVAMTRARRKLLVIGDSATLCSIPFYKKFIRYAEENGGYKSAWEL